MPHVWRERRRALVLAVPLLPLTGLWQRAEVQAVQAVLPRKALLVAQVQVKLRRQSLLTLALSPLPWRTGAAPHQMAAWPRPLLGTAAGWHWRARVAGQL